MSDDLLKLQNIIFFLTQLNNFRFMNRRLQLELEQINQNQILQTYIQELVNKFKNPPNNQENKILNSKPEEIPLVYDIETTKDAIPENSQRMNQPEYPPHAICQSEVFLSIIYKLDKTRICRER
jgi:hypothetical protein